MLKFWFYLRLILEQAVMEITWFTWTVLIGLVCITDAVDLFTSTSQIRNLVVSEDIVREELKVYINKEEKRIAELKKLLNDSEVDFNNQISVEGLEDQSQDPVQHPLQAFSVIKKFMDTYKGVASLDAASVNYKVFASKMNSSGVLLPDEEDMEGASAAILRLQKVYQLTTEDMAAGVVMGHQVSPLKADDCLLIGTTAFDLGEFRLASEWLHKTMELNSTFTARSGDSPLSDTFLLLARSHYDIYDIEGAIEYTHKAMEFKPNNELLELILEEFESEIKQLKEDGNDTTANITEHNTDFEGTYAALCRGEKLVSRDLEDRLMCRYRSTSIPYYKVKEEIMSFSPHIMMMHDVIHEDEIRHIKNITLLPDVLQRAKVGNYNGTSIISDMRVSKTGWLGDTEDGEIVRRLSTRIALLTGLDTTYREKHSSAESFQVVNYGLGGQYEPHLDYFFDDDEEVPDDSPIYLMGDRLATFMFYLSDVEGGGATVFPQVNVTVWPVKGAAAFWYNAMKTGEYDNRTEHAGCPVLLGEKWVANKWIHEYGQHFKRPCGLTDTHLYSIDE